MCETVEDFCISVKGVGIKSGIYSKLKGELSGPVAASQIGPSENLGKITVYGITEIML